MKLQKDKKISSLARKILFLATTGATLFTTQVFASDMGISQDSMSENAMIASTNPNSMDSYFQDGFYIGLLNGLITTNSSTTHTFINHNVLRSINSAKLSGSNYQLGAAVGYGFNFNRFHLDLQLGSDITNFQAKKNNIFIDDYTRNGDLQERDYRLKIRHLVNLDVRPGFLITRRFMVFADAGAHLNQSQFSVYAHTSNPSDPNILDHRSKKNTSVSFSTGLGLAYAITPKIDVSAEYQYEFLPNIHNSFDNSGVSLTKFTHNDINAQMYTLQLNYRF